MSASGKLSAPPARSGRSAFQRVAHRRVLVGEGAETGDGAGFLAGVDMRVDVLDGAAAIRRQRDPAVAHMQYAHRRAAKQVVNRSCAGVAAEAPASDVSRKVMRGLSRRSASMVIRPRRRSTRSSETLASLAVSVCTAGSLRAVLHLELAAHRDIGQEAHAHGPNEFDLASRPRRKLRGDPIPKARCVADQPGNEGDDENENRKQAEEKPFPWQLARLHAVRPTRLRCRPRRRSATSSMPPKTQEVLARLAGDSEPAARDLLGVSKAPRPRPVLCV